MRVLECDFINREEIGYFVASSNDLKKLEKILYKKEDK